MANKIGIVTGIKLEDALLRKGFKQAGHDVLTACAAGTVAGAQSAAQNLIDQGATHLISFGVCGGLSPYVKAGDLILADSVIMDGETIELKSAWHKAALKGSNMAAKSGAILSVATAISTPEAKHAAYEDSHAVAVDVESFAVAKAAKDNGLPCLIIRSVLDGAKQSLPEAALSGVDENGNTQIWPVIKSLLKRPQDLPALLNLARDSGRAQDTLKAAVRHGAPEFWFS